MVVSVPSTTEGMKIMPKILAKCHELVSNIQCADRKGDAFFVPFVKMHGCGNDYIFFDSFIAEVLNPGEVAGMLSDRNKGVGGDGIVLICPSDSSDAGMRVFNKDGSEAEMCGNAIRCVGKYLYESGRVPKPNIEIETLGGVKKLELFIKAGEVETVLVSMGKAVTKPGEIPVNLPGDTIIGREVYISGLPFEITCVSMGNPHAVIFHEDVDNFDLHAIGPRIENAPIFPGRTNVEVAEIVNRRHIKMRVWERGSGETMACGTGACATVVAAVLMGYCDAGNDIKVSLRGGELTINYTEAEVYMKGDAIKVFEGMVEAWAK